MHLEFTAAAKIHGATAVAGSKGAMNFRLLLDPAESKLNIAAIPVFCDLLKFFQELFVKLGMKRIWVSVTIEQEGKNREILLNINSIWKRTSLTRNEILNTPEGELINKLKNLDELKREEKKLNDFFPVDETFMISLKERNDRREAFAEHIKSKGQEKFSYQQFDAIIGKELPQEEIDNMEKGPLASLMRRDDRPGRLGAYKSHLQVLKEAKEKNLEKVFILEDDVRFTLHKHNPYYLEKAMGELPSDWGMLYLGHFDLMAWGSEEISDHLVRPSFPVDLHGYVIHERFYETLIALLEEELKEAEGKKARPIDVVIGNFVRNSTQVYATKDNLAVQIALKSDILNPKFDVNWIKYDQKVD